MYSLNEQKMFYDIADNQAIIINSSTGVYYALNPLASMVFDHLAKGAAHGSIMTALARIPGMPEDMEERLRDFIDRLIREEILIPGETAFAGEVALAPGLVEAGFVLEMDAFDEAQDILLADPVHDVDLGQGWPFLKEQDEE